MALLYELFAKNGEYTDKNGEQKVRWHKCGVVIESRNGGMAANIESLPTGFDGWLQIKPPKPKDAKEPEKANGYQPEPEIPAEDIPF